MSQYQTNRNQPSFQNSANYLNHEIKKPKTIPGYQIATLEAAQQYKNSQSYTKKTKIQTQKGLQDQYEPHEMCVDTKQLKKYGLGVYLFLEFVKRLAATLLIMSTINVLPLLYAYTTGTALDTYKQSYMISLAKTSLGNISHGDRTSYLVFNACDALSMLVFFIFYLHWRSFHNEAVSLQQKDINLLNPTSYVLSVVGFDPSVQSLQKQLRKYLQSKTGNQSIYQVQVVFNYSGNFSKFIHYDELIEKQQKQRQIIKQTQKDSNDLQKINQQIQQFQKQLSNVSHTFTPTHAVIHFRTLRAKLNFINFCRKYSLIDSFGSNLNRFIGCANKLKTSDLFNSKTPLIIKSNSLSRPEQINWPNLDVSGCSKFVRAILSILLLIVSIVISSSCIALCTLYVSSTSACTSYDPTTTITIAQTAGGQTLFCFCSANFVQIYTSPLIKSACGSLQNTILYSNIMQVGASLVSSLSNIILIVIITLIAKYILKSDSKPKQYSFIFVAVLISNYINSSILPLVMNGSIFGFQALKYLEFINFIDFQKVSVFKDYDVDWYAVVAPYYINFMIIAIIGPIISVISYSISNCLTHRKVSKACQNSDSDPIIQKQANAMITQSTFQISTQQALVCLYFSITIMYSSLLPILLPITTVVMTVTFLCKKAIILRYSVRIPADQALSQKTLTIMPFVILIHFLMGVWSHTAPGVFDNSSYIIKYDAAGILGKQFDRVFLDLIMLGGAGLVLLWIIIDYTIINFFGCIIDSCLKNDLQIPVQLSAQQTTQYQKRLSRVNILGSYKLINNPNYGSAIQAFKQLKNRMKRTMSSTGQILQQPMRQPERIQPIIHQIVPQNQQIRGTKARPSKLQPIQNTKVITQTSMISDQLNPQNQIRR